jgi:hypothetical protein
MIYVSNIPITLMDVTAPAQRAFVSCNPPCTTDNKAFAPFARSFDDILDLNAILNLRWSDSLAYCLWASRVVPGSV